MGVKLVSSGGGSVEINAPATASGYTATMPAGSGTVVINGVGGALVSATAVASTSGTSINFTDIPSWAKRITVMFYAVSTNGTSNYLVQVGNGSVVTSGYSSGVQQGAVYTSSGAGLIFINAVTAADNITGIMVVTNITGNTWTSSSNANRPGNQVMCGAGNIPLAGTLDRVRITTVNGTDTFDAGSINIMYE